VTDSTGPSTIGTDVGMCSPIDCHRVAVCRPAPTIVTSPARGGRDAETVVEPRAGGAIIDRGTDGSECRWARILTFDRPDKLVFSWDIGPTWQIETDPERVSEVEVRFVADGAASTRVELEHRHLDRHGPGWESVRDGIDSDQGWKLYLERYAALVNRTLR
jgi:uncharacterized protein YndB with AHSA1/START domain